MVFHEAIVKISARIGGAIRRDEQLCVMEERRVDGSKLNLHRPLVQARDGGVSRARAVAGLRRRAILPLDGAAARAGAAEVRRCLFRGGRLLLCLLCLDRGFVIGGGFALHKRDCARRAGGQTVAEPVAIIVADQLRFAVYHGDRPFVTGVCASAATVAEFLVDLNDLAYHVKVLSCPRNLVLRTSF